MVGNPFLIRFKICEIVHMPYGDLFYSNVKLRIFGLNGKDYDIFTIQPVMDNALDFIEQNAKKFVNGQNPYVTIIITEDEDGKVTKIR